MLNERIKELRKKRGITQEELAKHIGVSTSMVGMYETNARKPSYEVLSKIAKYFRVSTDYLLGETDYKTTGEKFDAKLSSDNVAQIKEEEALYTAGKFTTPQAAMQFILKQPSIMGYGGFDTNKMTDEEIIEFANELLNLLKMLGPKYNK
ncbi:TPA: helix-turn-helix transcriptional regulator [Clostridium botulinum]|uniref:helix-turn-helix domain-containing protein n=1 Tax=Clostridium botulinum TaxID=1491 RepID=UPI0029B61BDF|nr:helix-turn-helix transcriptional regulator [Clostridium botulinum]HDK7188757.1 helix-turn-helix transcriptional regulator [Clostridium botulinum]HDK7215676.1 helix-turn-helix transcriptional regulator [Clostridium botulinum]HDK7231430.1 helix-turn-helix transcriptional regulator [Clostridium botulinum]HDK7261180.1 helix-turn-helix transcriptional regulator [Clostridium botulinum]